MAVQAACNFSPYICVTCGHASDEHPGGAACNIGGGLTLAACQCGLFVPAIGPGTPTPPSTTHIPTAELPRTSERIAEIAARLRVPPMTEVLREVLPDLTPEAAVRAARAMLVSIHCYAEQHERCRQPDCNCPCHDAARAAAKVGDQALIEMPVVGESPRPAPAPEAAAPLVDPCRCGHSRRRHSVLPSRDVGATGQRYDQTSQCHVCDDCPGYEAAEYRPGPPIDLHGLPSDVADILKDARTRKAPFEPQPAPEETPVLSPEAAVRADRQRVYGDALECHTAIGRAWGGLLQQAGWEPDEPVPPHVVAAMMAALKLVRGVTRGGEYQADTYLDAKVYVGFLDEMHPGHPPRSPEELARDRDWAPCGECTHLRRVHAPDAGPCGAFECECHAFVML